MLPLSSQASLKRYLWFSSTQYYPGGGSGDVVGTAETTQELKSIVAASNPAEFNEVLDMQERRWLLGSEVEALGLPT